MAETYRSAFFGYTIEKHDQHHCRLNCVRPQCIGIILRAGRTERMKRITLKEIAEAAGVSAATVSRVFSGKGYVKEETRTEIERVLRNMGYSPSGLVGCTNRIPVIIGDLDNWYYMEIYRNIDRIARQQGLDTMLLYSAKDPEKEVELMKKALLEEPAGIIFLDVRNDEGIREQLERTDIPVVFVNRGLRHTSCCAVCNDNYHGGYQATLYLIQKGHRKIGHLAGSVYSSTAMERKRGFEDAMHDSHIPVTEHNMYQGNLDWESGYAYGEYIIKNDLDLTAIFSSGYEMTEGLIDFFQENRIRIPEDISVISFDETPSMKRAGITTICASTQKMGERAMQLLLKDSGESETIHLRPNFLIRDSVKNLKVFENFL